MPRTYVDLSRMRQIGTDCKNVANNVDDVHDKLLRVVRQLDWDVRQQENINATANKIATTLEGYTNALKSYKTFINETYKQYSNLERQKCDVTLVGGKPGWNGLFERMADDFDWGLIANGSMATSFLYLMYNGIQNGFSRDDLRKGGKKLYDMYKSYTNYSKIGRAVGRSTANTWWAKKMFGINSPGYLSTAKDIKTRWANNLFNNKTSPYNLRQNLSDALDFSNHTGANGTGKAVCAWASTLVSGATNLLGNLEEQKASQGTMTTERVIAETITETAVDAVLTGVTQAAVTSLVGTAIATVAPVAAVPVVVAAITGVAVWGVNTAVEYFTGQSVTEWVSDGIVDLSENIGNAFESMGQSIAGWFKKIAF